MARELIVSTGNAEQARQEVAAAGGHTLLVASPHLLVISLPDGVELGAVPSVSADTDAAPAAEQQVARAWIARFGRQTRPEDRTARAARDEAVAWDAPGHVPPRSVREAVARSTDTPTSVVLTGSVAVGVVVVSGPAVPPYWLPLHGSLKYVSAGLAGVWGVNVDDAVYRLAGTFWEQVPGALKQVSAGSEVWGVNASNQIYRRDGTAWTRIDGSLKHVSVANDGTVWGVNAQDEVYRRDGTRWVQVPGSLKQVSVGGAGSVWGVNRQDEIYHWTGTRWAQVPGRLKHVSVAPDGAVYGVNADDKIYRRLGTVWEQLTGRLKQISASSAAVQWGVNAEDEIFRHDPSLGLVFTQADKGLVMSEVMEGLAYLAAEGAPEGVTFLPEWHFPDVNAPTGNGHDYEDMEAPWRNAALTQLGHSGNRDGSRQFVRSLRQRLRTDWAYVAYFTKYPLHHFAYAGEERLVMEYDNDGWGTSQINRVFAHESCHIFGAADEYGGCGCGASGHHRIPNNNCRNCTSNQVPCLMDGNTLALCPWTKGQLGWALWTRVGGALKHVSAGADGETWGVNAANRVYRRTGDVWTQISGELSQVSVGDAANVWGVNPAGKIYRRTGSQWTEVPGRLRHVSVASDGTVWGVNAQDEIYRRDGNAWTQIPGALRQVSAGNAATVWGVNAAGKIYRRSGDVWEQIAGSLKHVAVASDGTVWGVNRQDEIYQRDGSVWRQFPGALMQVSAGSASVIWGVNAGNTIYRLR
ncbi:hypothetical protein Ade02nite_82190 [Paractinoplanes deccanensis]|uniref:Uncharacterized protein n=1 Tax=Paractinoplanes deccanensis TaxID=113561 RepID=A0ABQ3YHT6_9ACTN|nr:tectonin domain-containing protein [Actinoplanes deccanensis]GID79578.1 hypothetical protein Ade02nite_82190 [Actinoplanes deccanensis]